MSYLYIPFTNLEGNQDLRRLAGLWVAAVANDMRRKNPPEIKIHGSMPRILADIQPDESVYVLAHGTGMNDWISNAASPPAALMDYRQLALRLFTDALPLRHRAVKLYFCNPFGSPMKNFATSFKQEMWQLNYTGALEVSYYLGSVSVPREEHPGEYHKQSSQGPLRVDATGVLFPARASMARQRA